MLAWPSIGMRHLLKTVDYVPREAKTTELADA